MKKCGFLKLLFGFLLAASHAKATTCIQPGDWVPELCSLTVAAETRCALFRDNLVARNACAPQTDGCAAIGGCFGFVPPSHWWPLNDGGETKRCVCGCFAEETSFLGELGPITGSDLISQAGSDLSYVGPRIYGLESPDGKSLASFEINGIVHGPETKPIYTLKTASGKTVALSDQHPVLIVTEEGAFVAVKAIAKVKSGEFVLTDTGETDEVINITTSIYPGKMVNFNVMSENPLHHFVAAGGLILGDNAWQQRLASFEARIIQRADLLIALQKERVAP
jgi:hypothetical protein